MVRRVRWGSATHLDCTDCRDVQREDLWYGSGAWFVGRAYHGNLLDSKITVAWNDFIPATPGRRRDGVEPDHAAVKGPRFAAWSRWLLDHRLRVDDAIVAPAEDGQDQHQDGEYEHRDR